MKIKIAVLVCLFALLGSACPAFADGVQLTKADSYGMFTGSFDNSATATAARMKFRGAVYSTPFVLDLTDGNGFVTDMLFSAGGDALEFDGIQSRNPLIGTTCVTDGSTACLIRTVSVQNVLPLITSLNESGICCDAVQFHVIAADNTAKPSSPIPGPSSLLLLATGLTGGAGILRKRFSM